MEDKNESEKLMEELKRIGEGFNKFIESIGEALNKLFYPKEDEWEMKCSYKDGDDYWFLFDDGNIDNEYWCDCLDDDGRFKIGNTFPTKEAAELEAKRRNLLTRFRAFRDECNEDWKADWTNAWDCKFFVSIIESELEVKPVYIANDFVLFGYFKNPKDAERAIELFGDEIKKLFVDCEGE